MNSGQQKSGMAKRAFFGIGLVLFLVVATAVIVPLVVDVDKYRPEIVKLANEKINGKLEIGKLKLSLWGQIRIAVDGVKLSDKQDKLLLSVEDSFFYLPFASIFSGAPILTFKMQKPTVFVVKNKKGEINLAKVAKSPSGEKDKLGAKKEKEKAAPTEKVTDSPVAGGNQTELPSIVKSARMGVEFNDAIIEFTDEESGLSNKITDFNIVVRDISIERPTQMKIWADLDTSLAGVFSVKGPFEVNAVLTPEFKGTEFVKGSASMDANFDELEISVPGSFSKVSGIPTNMEARLEASATEAKINKFAFRFHNAEVNISGKVTNLNKVPSADIKVRSNKIALAAWAKLLPSVKGLDLKGEMELSANASGPADKLKYDGSFYIRDLSANADALKEKPIFNVAVELVTDEVKKIQMTMKAPGNDIRVNGSLRSFSKPDLKVNVNSTSLDLDRLIKFPPPSKEAKKEKEREEAMGLASGSEGSGDAGSGGKSSVANKDFDKAVDPIRKNQFLKSSKALVDVYFKKIIVKGVQIDDLVTKFTFRELVAAIEEFRLKIFKGTISSNFKLDFKPKMPTYSLGAKVKNLDLKTAVNSQLELFKNTFLGNFNFGMSGKGESFNPNTALRKLDVSGDFEVNEAVFSSIDVGKMTVEGMNKGIKKVTAKFPNAGNRAINELPGGKSTYLFVKSNFQIRDGKFIAPNFYAKAKKNNGVDIKGVTHVGMIDYKLSATWRIYDTYNMTGARDIATTVQGTKIEHILAEGTDPVILPVTVKGTLMEPQYSYEEVPGHFAGVAATNVGNALKGKAKAAAKEKAAKVINKIEKKVPKPAKKLLDKVKKKWF